MPKHKQPEQRRHRAIERLITNRPGLAQLHALLPQVWAERKHWPWLLPLGLWLFARIYRRERRKRP
jgi:hypothetical protein